MKKNKNATIDKLFFKNNLLKRTAGREAVLNILLNSDKHLSAEEIYVQIYKKNPSIGLTTVYRTLDLLEQKEVVNKFYFKDKKLRYEMRDEYKNSKHHHHLVCNQCGKIFEYTDMLDEETVLVEKMAKILCNKFNFKIQNHLLQFYGLCKNCSE